MINDSITKSHFILQVLTGSEFRFISASNSFLEALNTDENSVIGKNLEDVFPMSFQELLLKKISNAITQNQREQWQENEPLRPGFGTIHFTIDPLFDMEGNCLYLVGEATFLTNEGSVRTNSAFGEKQWDNIINTIGDPIFVKDDQSRLVVVNDAFCSIFGLSRADILGKTLAEDVDPEERLSFLKIDKEVLETGKENINEESLTVRGGETRFISTKKARFVDEKGNKYLVGIIRDITDRIKAEQELKLSKEYTDKLIMSMQEGLMLVDVKGKIIMVNESACNILGYTRDELIGMELPYPFAKIEDFQKVLKMQKRVAAGETPSFQIEFIRKNGEAFEATFLTGNITDDKGKVIALFGTMMDISKEIRSKRLLEENAIKSKKKKEVILKLASLVGHDLNNSFKQITQLASETLHVERVSVWSFNPDKSEILCENLFTQSNVAHTKGMVLTKADNPKYFEALDKNQAVLIENVLTNEVTQQFAKDYLIPNRIISLMDVFINSTEGYFGIICFEHVGKVPRNWTPDELQFASSIANIVSLMIESNERKIAENKLIVSNKELASANAELMVLRNKLEQENIYLRNELDLVFNFEEMVYGSVEFSNVLSEIEKVAPTNATVLLLGESGTGKELLARAIHNISLRNKKPLIKVNCSAIPRELLESELFGHKKGSFTGATSDKIGKFELADGGTLFLDEIGELPLEMQPKILRFLQEGEIEVVGGTGVKKLDVRIIAATNRNLKEEIERKQFREDLYFRLNVFPIEVPPLRNRKEDIPLLVEHFVDKFNKEYNKSIKYVSDAAMEKLKAYNWPGNIRELENLIERASILTNGETLVIPGFESVAQKEKLAITTKNLSLDTVQRNHIISVLEKCDWKISGPNSASELLELKPSTLRDKMSKLGIKK